MTKIRLARMGSTHQPYYRVIVTDSRKHRDGQYLELLGSYDPLHSGFKINAERAAYWIGVGAQPTNTTISLLTKAGVKHPFSVRRKPQRTKAEPVKETKAEAEVEAEAATEPEVETTVESAPEAETVAEPTTEASAAAESTTEAEADQTDSSAEEPVAENPVSDEAAEAQSETPAAAA